MAHRYKQILQVAATYVGTVVGAGFATGREVVVFFTQFGWTGVFGILVSSLLFIWLGTRIMILSSRIQAYSYQALVVHLAGEKMGKWINYLIMVILIGVTSVMLAGTGAIFKEQLDLPYLFGIIFTMLLCYLVISAGLQGIMLVNSIVVPVMMCFSLLLAKDFFGGANHSVLAVDWFTEAGSDWIWLLRAITYASLNLILAQAVLVPLGREIKDEHVLKWGGYLGGVGLFLLLLLAEIALMTVQNVSAYEIPMAVLVKNFGPAVHIMFLAVIYGEIFTTLIGNVFGLARQIHSLTGVSENALYIAILLSGVLLSRFGFAPLLSVLYPLFGYIGIFFMLLLILRKNVSRE